MEDNYDFNQIIVEKYEIFDDQHLDPFEILDLPNYFDGWMSSSERQPAGSVTLIERLH